LYKKILNDDSKENTWPRKGVGGFNCLTSVSDIDRKNLRTIGVESSSRPCCKAR